MAKYVPNDHGKVVDGKIRRNVSGPRPAAS